ncbi:MAG: tetratricopeptide repeat protein [Hyphomicrobiaceae bacterium]
MSRMLTSVTASAAALAFAIGGSVLGAGEAQAQKGAPSAPKVDCSKPANKNKAACKNKHRELSDDDLFYAGYWLARKGEYTLALHYLNQAQDANDPRIQTYIGYATRKLGDWNQAMMHYTRALEANPNYTVARAYMGEAFLQKGDKAKAVEQLGEIAARCGVTCDEYKELADALAKS